ncbi:MAG: hypothetical protein HN368_20465 [Spirochaetales bacterium]|jgi:histidinol phosphatase-like PHP family hydrolase|nr:hypothetical protein [Spirochaetales bacterium]
MKIVSDWHIHTRNSCDGACMEIADLVTEAAEQGVVDFGITDHVHTPHNFPDINGSREEYLSVDPSSRFHFGVEVSCVSQWELDEITAGGHENPVYGLRSGGKAGCALAIGLTKNNIIEYEIEFVVGGTHWPMYVSFERESIIRDYHRQNMYLAANRLVDVVAHPWWWMGHWMDNNGNYPGEPWLDDFSVIPKTMHQEFAAAAVEHDTAVEINIAAMLLNHRYPEGFADQYMEYLCELQEQGVVLSIGSDCHTAHYTIDFEKAGRMLENAGIRDEFWRMEVRG